jgi:hypothetical protein
MARRSIDWNVIKQKALTVLGQQGPLNSGALRDFLGISRASLARLVQDMQNDLLMIGRGRAIIYARMRNAPGLSREMPLYEVLADGTSRQLGTITPVMPQGYCLTSSERLLPKGYLRDLPYYLNDQRPNGFLGRLIPHQHQGSYPQDIRFWNADTTLNYLAHHGWNLSGSFIVGEESFRQYLASTSKVQGRVETTAREELYPRMAEDHLLAGIPGSSAAGEQPKFLATILPERRAVIVKFSPPLTDKVACRVGDLLVAEHLALETLRNFGRDAAQSRLLCAGQRIFLEVDRFDRTAAGGRIGLLSLASLDSEFCAVLGSWSQSVEALSALKIVPKEVYEKTLWLETFNQLIANTDMHFGNLSFLTRGLVNLDLAPAYDISPMLFAPMANQVIDRMFVPPIPKHHQMTVYAEALRAAQSFWHNVAHDERISRDFCDIAHKCLEALAACDEIVAKLPRR